MANKPLKSIKFPGLPDTYTVPQVDATPTQGSSNAVSSGGVYDKISSTSFFEQKMSVAMAEIIPNVVPILEMGDMTINSSGWTYNDGTARAKQRVRTAKGYSIPLKRGDKVGLTDYTDAKYYLGWKLPDGSYGSHGWYTADTTIAYDGDYVILLAHATEVDQTDVAELGVLLFVNKSGGEYNPLSVVQRSSGNNILKTTTWVDGYITSSGIHAPTEQLEITTDFITIDDATEYRFRLSHARYTDGTENTPWIGIATYDANRTYLRRPTVSTPVNVDDDKEYFEYTLIPNSGEKYIRISFRSFGSYSAELIAVNDGVAWYIPETTVDLVPTQGSTNAVSSGGVYEALGTLQAQIPQIAPTLSQSGQAADAKVVGQALHGTSFVSAKLSAAMAEIIPDVIPILEIGDMTINSSGWTYNDGTARAKQRVRTAKGYSIPLKRGDKVGLTDYTDAKFYLGWKLSDDTYDSHGWYTADVTIPYDGDYVILLAHNTEVDQTGVEELGNLLFVKKFGGHYNPVAVSQRSSGKDILKTTTWVVGYIDARGDVHAPTTQQEIVSDFIAIDGSTIYRMRLKHSRYTESTENNPWLGIASYDVDRHFVRRPAVSTAVYKDDEYEYLEMLFTPQSGEAEIRVSFRSFGDYFAELIALTDGISWYGYSIREPKDFQGGHNLFLKGVNHRGWGEYPENTLEAYIQSAIHGFNFVETDVRYTSDGIPVLLHDASINRTARNSDGTTLSSTVNIVDITYAQSQEYDFGIYKGTQFAGAKIPRFEDFIVLCKRLGLHPYIELKTGMTNAQIINLVDIVLSYGMEGDVTWIAYPTGWFNLISNKHKKSRFGVLMTSTSQTKIDSALSYRTGENSVFINTSDYDSTAVALAKTNGIPMEVWTLDEDEDIKALDPYITGVTSNLKIAGAVVYSNLTT